MDAGRALALLNSMLWNSMVVAGPVLIAILLVGLAVSILQVTTQIQEMTLSFVPKLLVAAALLILIGPWMMARLTQFAAGLYADIPSIVG